MNWGIVFFFTILYTALLLMIQRAEVRRRKLVITILVPIGAIIYWYANLRVINSEANTAIILALILNFIFWIVIGRYNPVGSSDAINVIGMDD